MTEQAKRQYWFKAKRYGWGWGLPQRWQGWLVFAVFVIVWATALVWLQSVMRTTDSYGAEAAIFIAVLLLDVALLVYFSFKYGEPPKWRWGKK